LKVDNPADDLIMEGYRKNTKWHHDAQKELLFAVLAAAYKDTPELDLKWLSKWMKANGHISGKAAIE